MKSLRWPGNPTAIMTLAASSVSFSTRALDTLPLEHAARA